MKTLFLLTSLIGLSTSTLSLAQDVMVIKSKDNTESQIYINNIQQVTFVTETNNHESPVAEAVDLGLPSGTLWASWNLGATKPEEFGDYYSWGETEVKDYYHRSTYKYYDVSQDNWQDLGLNIANTEYDVAHAKWDGFWRMPTPNQIEELHKHCPKEWTTVNGVKGVRVTGPNGASIFLPAAGQCDRDYLYGIGERCYYWTSFSSTMQSEAASYFYFYQPDWWYCSESGARDHGFSVRPVYCPNKDVNPVAEAIDLGLPSGTKWASWNIGATKPEEYGSYFSWGETEEKDYYYWNTYIHCDGTSETVHLIGNDIAGTEYDAAHVKWGGSWRMPSEEQIIELVTYCKRSWYRLNNIYGMLVTGPNGATIFFPYAGYMNRQSLVNYDWMPTYWLSSQSQEQTKYARIFDLENWNCTNMARCFGGPIRAVCP